MGPSAMGRVKFKPSLPHHLTKFILNNMCAPMRFLFLPCPPILFNPFSYSYIVDYCKTMEENRKLRLSYASVYVVVLLQTGYVWVNYIAIQ